METKGNAAAERRKYGIEEIPVSEIRERANELVYHPQRLRN